MAVLTAADTIAPPGCGRVEGFKAALFIARRTRGADRLALLEECGLLPYEAKKLTARGCKNTIVNYERPGH